jgi:LSU ribosomal protein L23P
MGVLFYPIATEKAVSLITKNNTITYIVYQQAKKSEIKNEFEKLYNVKVEKINIVNMPKNEKKAYIKLGKGQDATNVAMKLKLV